MKFRKFHIRNDNEFIPENITDSVSKNERDSTLMICNSGSLDIVSFVASGNELH